jgi:TPP-dependent pyruvate/acetoin dehydrogenase alpha subunit
MLRRDPIERSRAYLQQAALLSDQVDERIQQECTSEVDRAVQTAEAAEPPDAADIYRHLFSESRPQ